MFILFIIMWKCMVQWFVINTWVQEIEKQETKCYINLLLLFNNTLEFMCNVNHMRVVIDLWYSLLNVSTVLLKAKRQSCRMIL